MDDIINIYWQHSHEDDQGDTLAFRPKDYDFPPSRGREGFEFKENGIFLKHAIAPADGLLVLEGSWEKLEEPNTFLIQLKEHIKYDYPSAYKLQILDFNKKEPILKIKRAY